jgi:beta-mannanase
MIVPTGDTIGIGLTAGTKMRTSNRIGAIASDVATIEQNESNTSHRTRQFTPKADIQISRAQAISFSTGSAKQSTRCSASCPDVYLRYPEYLLGSAAALGFLVLRFGS